MGCLTLNVTPVDPASVTVAPSEGAVLAVSPTQQAVLAAVPKAGAALSAETVPSPSLAVTPAEDTMLTIGEVCAVSTGTIVVLAASDGLIYTRDGGYFLLNPETNPPEG